MTHSLICWKCGASLAALTLPFRRLEVCKQCNAELHVCRMCVDYDTTVAKSCREPIAEEVREKDRANFCDYYKPRPNAFTSPNAAEVERSKSGLDALFGGTKTDSAPDAERSKLDELFRK